MMASEAGVLDIPPENVASKGRLQPGPHVPRRHRAGSHHRRRGDQAHGSATERPIGEWLDEHRSHLDDLPRSARAAAPGRRTLCSAPDGVRLHVRGPAHADRADGHDGVEAVGSMGNDTPLACCRAPAPALHYFKQLSRRSPTRRSTASAKRSSRRPRRRLGSEGNLLNPQPSRLPGGSSSSGRS